MSENIVRHLVALAATIICALAYYAGYVSGIRGWWWTIFSVVVVYGGIYRLINK